MPCCWLGRAWLPQGTPWCNPLPGVDCCHRGEEQSHRQTAHRKPDPVHQNISLTTLQTCLAKQCRALSRESSCREGRGEGADQSGIPEECPGVALTSSQAAKGVWFVVVLDPGKNSLRSPGPALPALGSVVLFASWKPKPGLPWDVTVVSERVHPGALHGSWLSISLTAPQPCQALSKEGLRQRDHLLTWLLLVGMVAQLLGVENLSNKR